MMIMQVRRRKEKLTSHGVLLCLVSPGYDPDYHSPDEEQEENTNSEARVCNDQEVEVESKLFMNL